MDQKEIAKMLYEQKISMNKPIENPEGESAALIEMFHELQNIGYDYHIEDIKLRKNNDIRIMRILHEYLPQMESIYTKQIFIEKIDPKYFPDVLDYAIEEFVHFSPSDKQHLTIFDKVISKGKKGKEYFYRVSELLGNGDSYAALTDVRKMLCKNCPDLIFPYTKKYRQGVLILSTFEDSIFDPDPETTKFLNQCCLISECELNNIIGRYDYKTNQYYYELSVTAFEYWKALCTIDCIHTIAQRTLKKRSIYFN